jgi:hypothetical protein
LRLPFRATELSARRLGAALGTASLVCITAGCQQSPTQSKPHPDPAEPVPGIATTVADHIPPNALVCVAPNAGNGHATSAAVPDPEAPRITISVPDGWTSSAGTGDIALAATGPDGMSATVTIAATELDPAGSFLRYTANLGGSMRRLKFAVTGAQFCGYSSQRLTGTLQGQPGAIDFADRITHIWTNTKKYLVAIHLEGPVGRAGFDAARSSLMQDFGVAIP